MDKIPQCVWHDIFDLVPDPMPDILDATSRVITDIDSVIRSTSHFKHLGDFVPSWKCIVDGLKFVSKNELTSPLKTFCRTFWQRDARCRWAIFLFLKRWIVILLNLASARLRFDLTCRKEICWIAADLQKEWDLPGLKSNIMQKVHTINVIALCASANNGCLSMCHYLRTFWRLTLADVHFHDNFALKLAAANGNVTICSFFKDWGLTLADVLSDDHYAIRNAVNNGHTETFQLFLTWRDDKSTAEITVNDLRANDNCLLKLAAINGHLSICQILKNRGLTLADVRSDNNYILRKTSRRDWWIVYQFFKKWIDRNPVTGKETRLTLDDVRAGNNRALRNAVKYDCPQVCRYLKKWGLTVEDARSHDNYVARHLALCQYIDRALFFVEWGLTTEDLRAKNNYALRRAVKSGQLDELIFLKEHGLTLRDARAKNNRALRHCLLNNFVETCRFFKEWGLTCRDLRQTGVLNYMKTYGEITPALGQLLKEWGIQGAEKWKQQSSKRI
jgi:hypothetical protein